MLPAGGFPFAGLDGPQLSRAPRSKEHALQPFWPLKAAKPRAVKATTAQAGNRDAFLRAGQARRTFVACPRRHAVQVFAHLASHPRARMGATRRTRLRV